MGGCEHSIYLLSYLDQKPTLAFLTALRNPGTGGGDLCGSEGGRVRDEFTVHWANVMNVSSVLGAEVCQLG